MSVFTPFRNKSAARTFFAVGGALKLASALHGPSVLYAQQNQSVDIKAIAGQTAVFMPWICDNSTGILSTVIPAPTSTAVQVVAGSTGVIYVCGWSFASSAVPVTFNWVQGSTADACVTSEADKTTKYPFSSFSGISVPNSGAVQFRTSSAVSLCLNVTSTGDGGGVLTYLVST